MTLLSNVFKKWLWKTEQPDEVKPFAPHLVLSFDDQGLRYVNQHKPKDAPITLCWKDVQRVVVFKRDHFTVDCICICFELPEGRCCEFNEEMTGYKELIEKLPEYLPGCRHPENWFSEVAFPAFATNVTEIYQRNEVPETFRSQEPGN